MWDGIRNYQARNFMKDSMRVGDYVLLYHSNTKELGVVGEGRVCSKPYPDPTQFNRESKYFDPKSTKEKPRWFLVDICYESKFHRLVSLEMLREEKALKNMITLRPGNRLSITPVQKKEYECIRDLASKKPPKKVAG